MKLFKVVTYTEHWLTLLSARQFILAQNWRATFYTSISPLKTPKRPDRLQTEMHAEVRMRRMLARQTLDALPDFSIGASGVSFKQSFVEIESDETFFAAPKTIVDACRRILALDINTTVARVVHDNVTVQIGCNHVSQFALVNGGRDRALFTFRCVYDDCPAFLDIRKFAGAEKLKWVIVGVAHSHDFSFPSRSPRNTFHASTIEQFSSLVSQNVTCGEIKMRFNVLCNKGVFQNAVRRARAAARSEQARSLRDAVRESNVWSSEIHLNAENVFVEAFFANSVLVAKKLSVTFVYVDDTACSNTFGLPVISMLCRDSLNAIHAVAWGVLKNRTTEAFLRFFTFTAKFFPAITTFMCDRHHAQRKAISQVFGPTVHILHCCVHVGRNIVNNTGQNSTLSKLFWKMRYTRTAESEAMFLDALKKLHLSKKTTFSTRLFNSVDSFLPSKIDQDLKRETYPSSNCSKLWT